MTLKSLKEVIEDERIYVHARYYQKDALKRPESKDGSLVSFADCPARHLNDYKNPYAEVSERIYLCWLSDTVPHMYGEQFHRGCAFCMKNLVRGCCPNGFGNPINISEVP
jgi:hypothetical protein